MTAPSRSKSKLRSRAALNIDANCILFRRGVGPVGYPGAAEVVNMRAPDYPSKWV